MLSESSMENISNNSCGSNDLNLDNPMTEVYVILLLDWSGQSESYSSNLLTNLVGLYEILDSVYAQ